MLDSKYREPYSIREKLTKAIQEAEENISKGEVYSTEEVLMRTNEHLKNQEHQFSN